MYPTEAPLNRPERTIQVGANNCMSASTISVQVVVPFLKDSDRSRAYAQTIRRQRGVRVPEAVESLFSKVLVDVKRDYPK